MIIVNGELIAQGSQFSLNDVEVITGVVDLEEVRAYRYGMSRAPPRRCGGLIERTRSAPSRGMQAIQSPAYERIEIDFSLSRPGSDLDLSIGPSPKLKPRYHLPEEEIALGPAAWLWDYLRRSKAAGACASVVVVIIIDTDPQASLSHSV